MTVGEQGNPVRGGHAGVDHPVVAGGKAGVIDRLLLWRVGPNKVASTILFAVIAAVPFPFGSHDPATISVWCIALACALPFAAPAGLGRARGLLLAGVVFILAGYGVVIHEQLASAPWFAGDHPVWAEAAAALHEPLRGSTSIARYQPYFALGPTLANTMALCLGLVIGTDRLRARQCMSVFAWSGVAYAVYGIFGAILEPTMILWRDREGYIGNALGTFINRNTAATYFGCCRNCVVADPA